MHFHPPNKKNSHFESLWVEKDIFIHIWITGSPIPILFLPTTFFRCVGGVSHVSWYWIYSFCFYPPKPQKLSFWKPMSWKIYFHLYLDNQESDSHYVSSYNFIWMCGRCESCFKANGSTVCILTSQIQKTHILKAFELKKIFSFISG